MPCQALLFELLCALDRSVVARKRNAQPERSSMTVDSSESLSTVAAANVFRPFCEDTRERRAGDTQLETLTGETLQSDLPRCSITRFTSSMSLSPRPDRQTTIVSSGDIVRAACIA